MEREHPGPAGDQRPIEALQRHLVLGALCYANCDASTPLPTLNINDFICFLNKFVAGCP